MSKYKIGITEAGDAGIDLSWVDKLDRVDGAVVITKKLTPEFQKAVLAHQDKLVVHATVTGYGGSVLEPCVLHPQETLSAVLQLVQAGFPKEKVSIRVDPIIPTVKGLQTAKATIRMFMDHGFSRFRVSIIDMYPHVRKRFHRCNLPLPYGENGFSPSREQVAAVSQMLEETKAYWAGLNTGTELRIECCAEPDLTAAIPCGCISAYDLVLLGLTEDTEPDSVGFQRKNCLCYSGKTELLENKHQCPNGCKYCYWR